VTDEHERRIGQSNTSACSLEQRDSGLALENGQLL
jgi:hypothetical protein